jgi:hypothetical protein
MSMTATIEPIAPLKGQVFAKVWNLDDYTRRNDEDEVVDFRGDSVDANVTTSRVLGKDTHKVVLDLDLAAKLLPSSTPGHFHLYIDHEMTWKQYRRVLRALAAAGIIETGYLGASEHRGYTSVRLPWIKKENN